MPLLTTVIDDKSPLIYYDATWLPGSSEDDGFAIDYYLGTFQKNNVTGGTATFDFNGTTLWIYGANRPNHGTYTVQVDSNTYANFNGAGNNLFQQSLFSKSFSQGAHTVKLINTAATPSLSYVDIDMIVWQSEVGNPGDQLVSELIQDDDPRFQYQQSAWGTTSPSSNLTLNLFNNGTGQAGLSHATSSFKLIYRTGEAVTLFGTSGPSNGPYSTQLDGGQVVNYNASNAYPTYYGVAIYHADNLGPGAHQIVLTNLPDTAGQCLTIDYAQLWTLATNSSTSPSVTPCIPSGDNAASRYGLNSGVIVALVIEGVVAILAAAAAALFYRRWKTALTTSSMKYVPLHRSIEPTSETAIGIAPSLETGSSPSSLRNNTPFRPFAAVGRLPQQSADNGTATSLVTFRSPGSCTVTDGSSSAGRSPNEGGRRPLPEAPGGVGLPQPARFSGFAGVPEGNDQIFQSDAPPGYDTVVRGGHV